MKKPNGKHIDEKQKNNRVIHRKSKIFLLVFYYFQYFKYFRRLGASIGFRDFFAKDEEFGVKDEEFGVKDEEFGVKDEVFFDILFY